MNEPLDRPVRPPFGFRFVTPLALGAILNPINSTMLTTALVPIADSFHRSIAETGWLIAALYVTSAVAQPTFGRLVDLFGPRRIYLISLGFVALAGILGEWASTLPALVGVRVLLGIGTSGAYPAAMRLFRVQADRTGSEPPRVAMGFLSLSAISTMAVGPLVGGLLTTAFGWHAVFTVNLPLAILTIVLIVLWVPKDPLTQGSFSQLVKEVDLVGIGCFSVFLVGLMTFLMNVAHPKWWALVLSLVFGIWLVVHSLRRSHPFLNVRLLARNRPLTVTYIRMFVVSMVTYSIFYGFAQWLESSVGLTSAQAGLVTMPMSVVAAISSLTGVRTKGLRVPFVLCIGAAVVGCLALFLVGNTSPIWIIAGALAFFGVTQGLFSTATQAAIYLQAPADQIGAAAGLQRTAGYVGAVVAASLLGLMYGQRATDLGLHGLVLVLGVLCLILFAATVLDRTIPKS